MTGSSVIGLATPLPLRRQYSKPPVQEAVVSLHVEPGNASTQVLSGLHTGEEERYPVREATMTQALRFDPVSNSVTESSQSLDGWRIATTDRSEIAQFRQNQFVFSRLTPYVGWESWREEAKRLWAKYRDATETTAITRVGVRYVNRIDIVPEAGRRIRDYLRFYPSMPEELPQGINTFVMRVETRLPQPSDTVVAMNAGRTEPPGPGIYSVLLDIDVICTERLAAGADQVWELAEELHRIENGYFETCITDIARETFS